MIEDEEKLSFAIFEEREKSKKARQSVFHIHGYIKKIYAKSFQEGQLSWKKSRIKISN